MTGERSLTLTARWVFPADGPPLEQGTVTVAGKRIAAVEPHGQRKADRDFGNAALLPGLVNAHTHLDLTGLRGRCPPRPDFVDWLRSVTQYRHEATGKQVQAAIRCGLEECIRFGTTLIGDIASRGLSWESLAGSPVRATVYYEVLGLSQERAGEAEALARAWLDSRPLSATCRPGLSPHAPYSVRRSLLQAVADLARQHASSLPLAIHLAESPAELELLESRSGPFVAFLQERGVWDAEGLVGNIAAVFEQLAGLSRVAYVHGNFLDRATLGSGPTTLIYCPRTHAAFGHPPHPFRDFLAHGARVALGTDSLASNPDLDVLAEARFVHEHYPDLDGSTLLRMAALSGAEALGWGDETGSLTPGKSADLVVLPLPDRDSADPHALLFDSTLPVTAVMCRGRWLM